MKLILQLYLKINSYMNFNNTDTLLREVKHSKDDYAILNALTSLRQEIEKLIIEQSKKIR